MRINCEIKTVNRQLPSLNLASNKRSVRSSLAIGKAPGQCSDTSKVFLHICTMQNKQGFKYKIMNNIKGVFTKFASEGKFTIQLQEPQFDFYIKADPVLAKGFLKLLKMALMNKELDKLHFSHLNAVSDKQIKCVTKLTITDPKEYPVRSSFPHKLEVLNINGIRLEKIKSSIFNLKFLKSLDLSNNQISEIPQELAKLNLSNLNLSGNQINLIPEDIFNYNFKNSLSSLDLSNNSLKTIPLSILKLKKLSNLQLHHNTIVALPLSMFHLLNLKHLNLSNNLLNSLPFSLSHINLESLDVSDNPFKSEVQIIKDTVVDGEVPSLKEICASFCIKRSKFQSVNIPKTLIQYLENHSICCCSKVIIESFVMSIITQSLSLLASTIVSGGLVNVPVVDMYCSKKCWKAKLFKHLARH